MKRRAFGYRTFKNYRLRLQPLFGTRRLDRITLGEVQELVDELDADGMNASTIDTMILPLRLVPACSRQGHRARPPDVRAPAAA